jgi:hypothetical protein
MSDQGEITATVLAGSGDNASAHGPDGNLPCPSFLHPLPLLYTILTSSRSVIFCFASYGFAVVDETCSHAMMAILSCTGRPEALPNVFQRCFSFIFPTTPHRAYQPLINCPVIYDFAAIWSCFLTLVPEVYNLTAASRLVRLSYHQPLIIANASTGTTTLTPLLLTTCFILNCVTFCALDLINAY